MRMFVAVPVPAGSPAGLDRVEIPGLRWTPAPRHLTLVFLGELGEAAIERLTGALARVRHPACDLRLAGPGCFGGRRGRPLVVWVGVEDPEHALEELREKVVAAAREARIERDFGRFHAHVTVARGRRVRREALRPWLDAHRAHDFGGLPVREFVLYSSRLRPEGAEHRVVMRRELDRK